MTPRIVDIDSHVLEPPDLWQKNLEKEFRHRAPRLAHDENGLEYLEIDGRMPRSYFIRGGTMARPGAVGRDMREVLTPGKVGYLEGRPAGAYDGAARVRFMDGEEIDITLLYPTLGISLEAESEDSGFTASCIRVYNNWIVDLCEPFPERLFPIAHMPMQDVDEAVRELRRLEKLGVKGVFVNARPVKGLSYGDPYYDPFWAQVQEMGIPVSLHAFGGPWTMGSELYPQDSVDSSWWIFVMVFGDSLIGMTTLFKDALFERFPQVKIVVLEAGCGWLPYWLDRMDGVYEAYSFTTPMKRPPSEYFKRQCWISMDPDETTTPVVAQAVGADRLFWASDYPHSGSGPGAVAAVKGNIASLPEPDQWKILGENGINLYGL
ncbi:MAG: amidohydrolase [Chloroflexi bacterium]|nr:amidohydrolase [Chloroflexota bacterium]